MSRQIGWKVSRELADENLITVYEDLLASLAPAVDVARAENGLWKLTAFFGENISPADLDIAFSLADAAAGRPAGPTLPEPVYEQNWQEEVHRRFPPVVLGGFFVHSFDETPPAGLVSLKIPAGMAFGTGDHPTTNGCLLALEGLLATGRTFKNGLDMGCGSGILSIAAAKKAGIPFLSVDIDAPSVETCRENAAVNGVGNLVTPLCGNGFAAPQAAARAPYDLIFANILMQPLLEIAPDLAHALAPGGLAILSGYLENQVAEVEAAYTAHGLEKVSGRLDAGWQTSVFSRP